MELRFIPEAAMDGDSAELEAVRQTVDSRYDDIKSGRVKPVDGPAFFQALRKREIELLKGRSSK